MQRNDIVKGVFIVVPLTVAFMLYGLWLVMDTPVYMESMIVAGIVLMLASVLFLRFLPRAFDFVMGADQTAALSTVRRTSIIGGRELIRLVFLLILGRGLFMLGAFLWSLKLKGYTETVFDIQHIWADHMYAARVISLANKGYGLQVQEEGGRYLNLLFPPVYSFFVRLISPMYLSSIRAAFYLSNLNAILSGVVLYLLVLHDSDRKSAVRALWFYSILPPSFLLTCTVPASTFMLLSLLSVYLARRRRFVPSAVVGCLAALTDRAGIALMAPLLLEFFPAMTEEYRSLKEVTWRFYLNKGLVGASIALVPLGFILYLVINREVGGSLFTYAEYLEDLFDSRFALFYRVSGALTEKLVDAYRTFDRAMLFGVCLPNLIAAVGSLGLMLLVDKQMRVSYLAYFMVSYLLIFSRTGVLDGPRQLFCCFPVILSLVYLAKKGRLLTWVLSLLSIGSLAIYLGMYVAGWPVA